MQVERSTRVLLYLKAVLALLTLCIGVWALWPPRDAKNTGVGLEKKESARYVIKFFPGGQYMPGTLPFGLGKPLHGVTDVIQDFERCFPDTRIEVISAPSAVREYLVTQLSTGEAPDIIMTTVEDVWPDIQKEWYIPLDAFLDQPNAFVQAQGDPSRPGYEHWWDMFKYQAISRAKAAPDGRYYTLTFDMVETGIFYNKTLFKQIGVEVPETWEELCQVCAAIKKYRSPEGKPITPLLIHLDNFNSWATDLIFDQLYYDIVPGIDLVKDPVRGQYIQGYLDWDEMVFLHDKGFFTRKDPRYLQIWPIMHELAQYCNRDLLADTIRDFVTQRGAMFWNISIFSYRLSGDKDIPFEWGVFYMPSISKATSPYASGQPMCGVGGPATSFAVTNTAISDTPKEQAFEERIKSSERLKRAMSFLQFITLPENYARIVNEYPCFMPNITGVEVLPPLKPFEETLNRRYATTKWIYTFDLKFSEVQRRMLQLYLTNGISLDDFLDKWQFPNVSGACTRAKRRMVYHEEALNQAWERLAPLRESMKGLPQ